MRPEGKSCEITRIIGSGGMGIVYEAWDARLQRRVALKVMHPHLLLDPDHRECLLREARLAARVEHPRVVRIYDIEEHEGQLAIKMQYIEGFPLGMVLSAHPMTPSQTSDLLRQVLEALGACHAQGVVHCDLKPGNLLITAAGEVYLTDFGIARGLYLQTGKMASASAYSNPLWGTPQYAPPEAWEGASPTPKWDFYALGVVAHEALTGTLPFDATTPAMLMREKLERPVRSIVEVCPALSPQLSQLIDALRARNPDERPATADVALSLLLASPEHASITASTQPLHLSSTDLVAARKASERLTLRSNALTVAPRSAPGRIPFRLLTLFALLLVILFGGAGMFYAISGDETAAELESAADIGIVKDFFVARGTAFFSYNDGERGRELWRLRDSGEVRLVADINPGISSSNPTMSVARIRDHLFMFTATTAENGEEPWLCGDGGVAVDFARILQDIVPGKMSSQPRGIGAVGDGFLFFAKSLKGEGLYYSNGELAQTGLITDSDGKPIWSDPSVMRFASGESEAFLTAMGGPGFKLMLWRYSTEDHLVTAIQEVPPGMGEIKLFKNELYVVLTDDAHGTELWRYDRATNTLALFADVAQGPASSNPAILFPWNDQMYFQAETSAHGRELWRTDGTIAGTAELADISPGKPNSNPYDFVPAGDALYFRAENLELGNEPWVLDTHGVVRNAADIVPGIQSSNPYNLSYFADRVYFSANDGTHGEELWELDPATGKHRLVADLWPGQPGAEPHDLSVINEATAAFVYKTKSGDALMRMVLMEGRVELVPAEELPG